MYVNIFTISVPRWVITNSVSLAPLTQLRSRELTMKYSALVGSAAPCQDPTCPGPSWLGRSPPSWPRARRPSRRRTRTNEQKRNQIFFTIENQDKPLDAWILILTLCNCSRWRFFCFQCSPRIALILTFKTTVYLNNSNMKTIYETIAQLCIWQFEIKMLLLQWMYIYCLYIVDNHL